MVESEVVVDEVVDVVLYVVTVLASVTPRKLDAKSRLSPAGQTLATGATEQPTTEIK